MALWLIGGTSESRDVAGVLSELGCHWVVTVTTPSAAKLYQNLTGEVRVGKMTPEKISQLIAEYPIQGIVDASHPFATEISQSAIATQLPYLRFERPQIPMRSPPTTVFANVEEIVQWMDKRNFQNRRILLTLGVKALPYFIPWQPYCQIWARILPSESSREQAIAAGFHPEKLILQRTPAAKEPERQLWQKLNIDTVITKASGQAGGFDVKQAVALEMGIDLWAIQRPNINYPQQTSNLSQLRSFCQSFCRSTE
ncbi:cobalt-precorrin-6A reductase [Geitlerinema sp. PCC 9228]|uniref:cobalt-precorrin-6A reductase n=1 Tax=Geitlerinema sp. PCC 9228 TaxID=111611 RepID=UPI0008F9BB1F|nr:cobalt-precorrin-6A reductase [Geitlerinema sp. PCC 9228]